MHLWLLLLPLHELYSSSPAFQRKRGDAHHSMLVIQCDSGHLNADLIACARYRIYDKRAEASWQNEREGHTHVLFIIHLPRQLLGSLFVGFQGNPWISAHIDNLRPFMHDMITLHEAIGMSISYLFYGKAAEGVRSTCSLPSILQLNGGPQINSDHLGLHWLWLIMWWVLSAVDYWSSYRQPARPCTMPVKTCGRTEEDGGRELCTFTDHSKEKYQCDESEVMQVEGIPSDDAKVPERPSNVEVEELVQHTPLPENSYLHTQFRRLHDCIQPAASCLQDSSTNKGRATKRVAILVSLIPRNPSYSLGMEGLCVMLN